MDEKAGDENAEDEVRLGSSMEQKAVNINLHQLTLHYSKEKYIGPLLATPKSGGCRALET